MSIVMSAALRQRLNEAFPGEYIEVGSLASPYVGPAIDGVPMFPVSVAGEFRRSLRAAAEPKIEVAYVEY